MLSRPPYKSESGLPPGISHGNQTTGKVLRPRRPYPSRLGGQPPNPRSSNAGEAEEFAARADTLSPSGV